MKKVAVIMGSDSDFPVVSKAVAELKAYGVPYECHVMSAHRTPALASDFADKAKENGFGDVGMNSFNHYAYGSVVEWMYRYMAGIEPGTPGFETVILQPRIDRRTAEELPDGQKNMTYAKASYKSAAGLIESEWHNENGFTYRCVVPVTAELRLPILGERLTVNGVEHSFEDYESENGCAVIRLAPGEYVFEEK